MLKMLLNSNYVYLINLIRLNFARKKITSLKKSQIFSPFILFCLGNESRALANQESITVKNYNRTVFGKQEKAR